MSVLKPLSRRLLLALILLLPFAWLGAWPLIDPDEARNAEVAREMLATGDWIAPHINGLPRLDKPLLPYAATAASLRIFGLTPFAVRFPAALAAALASLFVVYGFRRDLGDDRAVLAAAMMASSPLVIFFSRGGTIDALLLLWFTAGAAAFWRALTDERSIWSSVAWLAMALGILTKGPVALLPLAVAVAYAIIHRVRIAALFPPPGIAAAVAVVTPWIVAIQQRFPDFIDYVISVETVARTTSTELGRSGPIILPVATLAIGTLPWIAILLRTLFEPEKMVAIRSSHFAHYLALWIGMPLILFTIISSRRPQYVLPLVPAVAMLATLSWPSRASRRASGVSAIALGLLLLLAAPFAQMQDQVEWLPLLMLAVGGAVIWIVAGILILRWKIAAAAALLALFPLALIPFLASEGPVLGGAATASQLRARGLENGPLYGLHTYSPSLAFNLRRTYRVITHHGRELGGNYINHHYENLVDAPGSPLRSRGWYDRNLDTCAEPMIVIARADDRSTMTHLREREVPIIFSNERFVVAEPCPGTEREN